MVWPRFTIFWFSKDNPKGHCKRKQKKKQTEEEVERHYQSGQEWTLTAPIGRLKTGQDGKGLLQPHLWCSDDLSRLQDRIENAGISTFMSR